MSAKPNIDVAIEKILARRMNTDPGTSVLVGVSGIDASGKGFVTDRIVERLIEHHSRAVAVHGDGWLNLPVHRFNIFNPGEHFYKNAIRMGEMFEQLVLPLKRKRFHKGVMDFVEENASTYRIQPYAFENV